MAQNEGAGAFSYPPSSYLNTLEDKGLVLPLCKAASHCFRLSSLSA